MAVDLLSNYVSNDKLKFFFDARNQQSLVLNEVEVLVVAGGGGGGCQVGGGGGGGGVLYSSSYTVTPGVNISVTVGTGGTAAANNGTAGFNGGNSVFGNLTAIGGGRGGNHASSVTTYGIGASGGSGGGGAGANDGPSGYGYNGTGGSGTAGQGFAGGYGRGSQALGFRGNGWAGGGGGGASEPGQDATINFFGGKGGDGLPFSISGQLRYYGGGGGGCNESASTGFSRGGKGGGGRGKGNILSTNNLDGAPNTGGGGGGVRDPEAFVGAGGGTGRAGNGGSGIVIVRYYGPQKAFGGDRIELIDGYTVHTFTTPGTTTFSPQNYPANGGVVFGLEDLSGNGNHAVIRGNQVSYSTVENAFQFTAPTNVDHGLEIKNLNFTSDQQGFDTIPNMTLDFWCKSESTATTAVNDARILISYDRSQYFRFGIGGDSTADSSGKPTFQFNANGVVYDRYASSYSGNLRDDSWHQVCVVYYPNKLEFYVDGQNVTTLNETFGAIGQSSSAETPRFGIIGNGSEAWSETGPWGPTQLFYGYIAQAKFYLRSLSSDEIYNSYETTKNLFI